jgi:hypothetical protein
MREKLSDFGVSSFEMCQFHKNISIASAWPTSHDVCTDYASSLVGSFPLNPDRNTNTLLLKHSTPGQPRLQCHETVLQPPSHT